MFAPGTASISHIVKILAVVSVAKALYRHRSFLASGRLIMYYLALIRTARADASSASARGALIDEPKQCDMNQRRKCGFRILQWPRWVLHPPARLLLTIVGARDCVVLSPDVRLAQKT